MKTATIGMKYVTLLAKMVVEFAINLLKITPENAVPTKARIPIKNKPSTAFGDV